MSLTIDLAGAARTLDDDEFRAWARDQTVFLSSVMGELAAERETLAQGISDLGLRVRWFEEFGGRDDSAEVAYLSEVSAATIYVGLLGDEYGTMLDTGFSATHAEYLEARRTGRRISFWARSEASNRQGHARSFLSDVQVFHVTGSFATSADLPAKVECRLREIAADDLAPWVKLGDVVMRADTATARRDGLIVRGRVDDQAVLSRLEALSDGGWGRPEEIQATQGNRSGRGHIEDLEVETRSAAFSTATVTLALEWTSGTDSMRFGTSSYTADDLGEIGLRMSLLGEAQPERFDRFLLGNVEDPLAPLVGSAVPERAIAAIARLLLVEYLVGGQRAGSVEAFSLGPVHHGRRRLALSWKEPKQYANAESHSRAIEGALNWS